MKIYDYDIWGGDKGIIFANSMEEAENIFKYKYPDVEFGDEDEQCVIRKVSDEVPTKPTLLYVID